MGSGGRDGCELLKNGPAGGFGRADDAGYKTGEDKIQAVFLVAVHSMAPRSPIAAVPDMVSPVTVPS